MSDSADKECLVLLKHYLNQGYGNKRGSSVDSFIEKYKMYKLQGRDNI